MLSEWGFALSALAVNRKDAMPSGSTTFPVSGFYHWAVESGLYDEEGGDDPFVLVTVQQNLAWRHFTS